MKIAHLLSEIPRLPPPLGLIIGSFDGVHLGHLALIQNLRQSVGTNGCVGIFTFTNHPAQILKNRPSIQMICTLPHKLLLLQKAGVDLIILQEFDLAFASQPYDLFLNTLLPHYPFSVLVLGEGDSFGKDKQGNEKHLKELGEKLHFEVTCLKKLQVDHQYVSSGLIRSYIEQGHFREASQLLGRPYSIYTSFERIDQEFHLESTGLCLPPDDIYEVTAIYEEELFSATASLHSSSLKLQIFNCEKISSKGMLEAVFFKKHS